MKKNLYFIFILVGFVAANIIFITSGIKVIKSDRLIGSASSATSKFSITPNEIQLQKGKTTTFGYYISANLKKQMKEKGQKIKIYYDNKYIKVDEKKGTITAL